MKRFLELLSFCTLAILSVLATTQSKKETFLRLSDSTGQMIRGTSVDRDYERQIVVTAFSGVATGNAQVQFTMPSGGASAALANLQGRKDKLQSAVFTITERGETGLVITSTVRIEEISVISVAEANGNTEVKLQAARIGTTYYQLNRKTGASTVSGKTGFDFITQKQWTAF